MTNAPPVTAYDAWRARREAQQREHERLRNERIAQQREGEPLVRREREWRAMLAERGLLHR
jgi:hypothetical protein